MLQLMATSRNDDPTPEDEGLPGTPSEYELEYRAIVQSEALWAMADNLELDVRERKFVWPDGSRLTLQESMEHICGQRPDVGSEQVDAFLISFIEGYAPEDCSEEAMDEIDRLAEEWLGEIEDGLEAE
jgi:hypothetical protein